MALSVVYSSVKNFTSIVIFYFSFNFAIELFYIFNMKGFGRKKLPQRKGGNGKGHSTNERPIVPSKVSSAQE